MVGLLHEEGTPPDWLLILMTSRLSERTTGNRPVSNCDGAGRIRVRGQRGATRRDRRDTNSATQAPVSRRALRQHFPNLNTFFHHMEKGCRGVVVPFRVQTM